MTNQFLSKLGGALYGQAIGDGMGAPVEGWAPEKIASKFSTVFEFLPPTHGKDPRVGKGDGRITDDTLMAEALIRAYVKKQDHLNSYDFANILIPEISQTKVWLPERQQEMAVLERLYWPEKFPWQKLAIHNAEPRSAGIGNMVNCGVAMYMMPVGAVNAGNPQAAYEEAASLGIVHNESFAVEAGAVMAGASAEALASASTIDSVISTALSLAKDGTALAIHDVLDEVDPSDDLASFIQKARNAFLPYDQRTVHVADDQTAKFSGLSNYGRPSRISSIEELPVALAALKYGNGSFHKTIHAAVFYGRDCDSIAAMAGALFGGIFGIDSVPENLRQVSDRNNRRNYLKLAEEFAQTIGKILQLDTQRHSRRMQSFQ